MQAFAYHGGQLGAARRLVPDAPEWTLEGSMESLDLVESASKSLHPNEVRIEVRAAGINFRDVLIALGTYPEAAAMGSEAAGVVEEVGSGVSGFRVGDRVTVSGVTGDVVEHIRGEKKLTFKMKRRKGYHKSIGHRQELTVVKITDIKL